MGVSILVFLLFFLASCCAKHILRPEDCVCHELVRAPEEATEVDIIGKANDTTGAETMSNDIAALTEDFAVPLRGKSSEHRIYSIAGNVNERTVVRHECHSAVFENRQLRSSVANRKWVA